jgi:pimeloyl-ACP methyl ester carboxylesterase
VPTIEPFRIAVPQEELDDLYERLNRTRWPSPLPASDWRYGVPPAYLQDLAQYWRHGYDWRAAEARLNEWPQFTTTIDGTRVHFAHVRSTEAGTLPLLITHGWPGSIVEFTEIAGPLSEDFDLVMPTIPGFGISGPVPEPGWEIRRVAAAFGELMDRLGYQRYGVQGGDWGAAIARELGRTRPDRVVGVHLNLLPQSAATEADVTDDETRRSWEHLRAWAGDKQGYADLQSTRPQTLAYLLADSPVGQLAWIAEKFHDWTDPATPVGRDHLLTNVMLYWLTRTGGSSGAIYYERAHSDWPAMPMPSTTPTALAVFPHDNFIPVRRIAERTNNIVRWTEYDRGGHFPALEVPDLLVEDIRAFFSGRSVWSR